MKTHTVTRWLLSSSVVIVVTDTQAYCCIDKDAKFSKFTPCSLTIRSKLLPLSGRKLIFSTQHVRRKNWNGSLLATCQFFLFLPANIVNYNLPYVSDFLPSPLLGSTEVELSLVL